MKDIVVYYIKRVYYYLIFPLCIITGRFNYLNRLKWIVKNNNFNLFKTLEVNFASFPFKTACKLPIWVYEDLDFANLGEIEISGNTVKPGMVKINCCNYRAQGKTKIVNFGRIVLGDGTRIFGGSKISVFRNAELLFKGRNVIGENTIVYVEERVEIGFRSAITFNSSVADTNSHFVMTKDGKITPKHTSPISIGDYNWICNNCSIKSGTKTPDHIIVAASYAVLQKDYTSSVPPYSVLAGNPAKQINADVVRIWSDKYEQELLSAERSGKPILDYSVEDIEKMKFV